MLLVATCPVLVVSIVVVAVEQAVVERLAGMVSQTVTVARAETALAVQLEARVAHLLQADSPEPPQRLHLEPVVVVATAPPVLLLTL